MHRRDFLLASLFSPLAGAATADWNYTNAGPARWGELDGGFKLCSTGDQQSPVDLHDGIHAQLPPVHLDWKTAKCTISNNGHTIQVGAPEGSFVEVGSMKAPLTQLHFHAPSEHAVAGNRAPMEVHFVHQGSDGGITVLAVLLAAGGQNAEFSAIIGAAPKEANGKVSSESAIDPSKLLPADRSRTWRYRGSLTTPPCSQNVDWIIFEQPLSVAQADIDRFRSIFPLDARPLQPLNRRFLLQG
jgi:carbonic anhydrase